MPKITCSTSGHAIWPRARHIHAELARSMSWDRAWACLWKACKTPVCVNSIFAFYAHKLSPSSSTCRTRTSIAVAGLTQPARSEWGLRSYSLEC